MRCQVLHPGLWFFEEETFYKINGQLDISLTPLKSQNFYYIFSCEKVLHVIICRKSVKKDNIFTLDAYQNLPSVESEKVSS